MKKSLLFAAAIATACAANAEVFNYGFGYENNPAFPFLSVINNPDTVYYNPGNYDLINKYGVAMPNIDAVPVLNIPEGEEKGVPDLGVGISFYDGGVYKLTPDAYVGSDPDEFELEEMPADYFNYPILSWGEKGMTRTILMPGWGSEEAWEDKDYNAATEADWVPTKNGIQFTRLGDKGIVSRQDTYIQFPAVTGNVTVTAWGSTTQDKNSNPDNLLKVIITPVFDGVAAPEQAVEITKENPASKRYYKLESATFDATGKNLAVRVGCNGALLNLMYVRIEGEPAAAVEGVAVDAVDAPAYNLLGVQVDSNYKGLVIKNGKKFVQK